MKALALPILLMGCAAGPPPVGMTMVEETTCIGAGGQVVIDAGRARCRPGRV